MSLIEGSGSGQDGAAFSAQEIEDQLSRITRSPQLAGSAQLVKLLRFMVRERLAGNQASLKQSVIGTEVFERDPTFDPREDSVVRVQTRRLRLKLEEYYAAGGVGDPILIELPKGNYVPVFRRPVGVPASRSPLRWRNWKTAAALAALLCTLGAWSIWRTWAAGSNEVTLVLLPFVNLSKVPENDYFCEGLTEELASSLAQVPGVQLIAAESARRFARAGGGPAAAASTMKAELVAEGSVRREDDRVRVAAHLLETGSGRHIWSEVYERAWSDTLHLEEEIASAITRAVQQRLRSTRPVPVQPISEDLEARRLYWQAIYARRQPDPDSWKRAVSFFEQSTQRDPRFAMAHASLADTLVIRAFGDPQAGEDLVQRGRAAALQALVLEPKLAQAHSTVGAVQFFHDWDWPAAEASLRRALRLNPNLSSARSWYSLGLLSQGRFEQAIRELRTGQALDPLSYMARNEVGVALYVARRYGEALTEVRRMLSANPEFHHARVLLGLCLLAQGEPGSAISELEKARASMPAELYVVGRLGQAYAVAGKRVDALSALQTLEEKSASEKFSYCYPAYILAALGEKPRAIEALEKAAARHDPEAVFLAVEPAFDSLQGEPRFKELAARVRRP